MKRFLLSVASVLLTSTAFPRQCSNDGFGSFCETKEAVFRLLSYPAYTGSDEKVLNRAGDMAALAIISSVSTEDLNSPEKARQILDFQSEGFPNAQTGARQQPNHGTESQRTKSLE
jgi:hypothetical protein